MDWKECLGASNPLAKEYSKFRVEDRILLTGHSHQAWPDCGIEGQLEAWENAAELVDGKWERAFEKAREVEQGFRKLLGDTEGSYAFGSSVHELFVRFLSSLRFRDRPRIVTTTGEFHSIRRQLARVEEEGIEVVRVRAFPEEDVCARLAKEVSSKTSAVVVSAVFYESGMMAGSFSELARECEYHGVELLVDAYHALNVVPFDLVGDRGLVQAWITGGGYKYCQLGEGNCFLRIPPGVQARPLVTGWLAEFEMLSGASHSLVFYPSGGSRFAGSTYDPTSHYRASRVFRFFEEKKLDVAGFLRPLNQAQVARLVEKFDAAGFNPRVIKRNVKVSPDQRAGFLALECSDAVGVQKGLLDQGVWTDCRGSTLRLGPAPYVSVTQLDRAIEVLREVAV